MAYYHQIILISEELDCTQTNVFFSFGKDINITKKEVKIRLKQTARKHQATALRHSYQGLTREVSVFLSIS